MNILHGVPYQDPSSKAEAVSNSWMPPADAEQSYMSQWSINHPLVRLVQLSPNSLVKSQVNRSVMTCDVSNRSWRRARWLLWKNNLLDVTKTLRDRSLKENGNVKWKTLLKWHPKVHSLQVTHLAGFRVN